MGSLADYAENKFLDHVIGNTAMALPSVYLAIGAGNSDPAGLVTEVTGLSYARIAVAGAAWNAAASRTITNNGTITFATAGVGGWGTPDSWAIYDAATGGNCLFYGDITTPKLINAGQTPSFAANTINCTVNASAGNVGMATGLANSMLNHLVGKTTFAQPAALYVGFGTTPLTDTGTITGEASTAGTGYARTATGAMATAALGATQNSAAITFTVSGTWTPSLDVLFISDAQSSGVVANANLMFFGQISAMSPISGDTVQIAIGDLDLTLA